MKCKKEVSQTCPGGDSEAVKPVYDAATSVPAKKKKIWCGSHGLFCVHNKTANTKKQKTRLARLGINGKPRML